MSRTTEIQQLYIGLLGRAADAGGLNFWASSEYSIDEIAARIVHSADEFPRDDRPTMIGRLFENLFNRTADEADISFWEGWLDQYDASLDVLLMNLIRYPSAQDGETLNNRGIVAEAFTKTAAGTDKEQDLEAAAAVIANVDHTVKSVADALGTIQDGDLNGVLVELQVANANADAALTALAKSQLEADATQAQIDAEKVVLGTPAAANALVSTEQGKVVAAEAAVQTAIGTLAAARASDSDAALQQNLKDAQDAVSADTTAKELFEAVNAANNALVVHIGTTGTNQAVAQNLFDAVVAFETAGGTPVAAFDDFKAAYTAALSATPAAAQAAWALAINEAGAEITVTAEGEVTVPALVGATAELRVAVREVAVVVEERSELLSGVGVAEAAFATNTEGAALRGAEQAIDARDGLIADVAIKEAEFAEAQTELAEISGLVKAYTNALDAIDDVVELLEEEFGIDNLVPLSSAGSVGGTATEADLYMFSSATETGITLTTFEDEDMLYLGDGYNRIDLEAGVKIDETRVGEATALEVFFQQEGANVKVYVEQYEGAGNVKGVAELVEITLNGVNLADVGYSDGFVTVA